MKNYTRKIKSGTITLLILAVVSCSNNVPLQNKSVDNFADLIQEYHFSTKDLTESYLLRKLNTWLAEPVKGDKLVKEILFASQKYPDMFRELMLNDQELLNDINAIGSIQDRRAADSSFNTFMAGCAATTVQAWNEFHINTSTIGPQRYSKTAMDDDGNFIVIWQDYVLDGGTGGVYARRYNSNGQFRPCSGLLEDCNPETGEFRVNGYTTDLQVNSSVAMDSDGDFVVTWQSRGQDQSSDGIYARRFNSNGEPQLCSDLLEGCIPATGEFRVNTYTLGYQIFPNVAMNSSGQFIITWTGSQNQDGSEYGVFAQQFGINGEPLHCSELSPQCNTETGEFRVNSFFNDSQQLPSAAMDDNGNFVITWQSAYQDDDRYGIYAQRYNSEGTPLQCSSSSPQCNAETGEFRVNSFTAGNQSQPKIAMDSGGDFIITWMSYDPNSSNTTQDGSLSGVYAQRYNSIGEPRPCSGTAQECNMETGEFRVNTYTSSEQKNPAVAMDDNGDFVITWRSNFQDENLNGLLYGYGYEIFSKRYNSSGIAQKPEFRVHELTFDWRDSPAIAMDRAGDFVITWQSYYHEGPGGDYGIYGQRYSSSGIPL
jgi:hypothetical protein